MLMIEETFTLEHLAVTLRVEGKNLKLPVDGEAYKVWYFDKGEAQAETEWLENFNSKNIYAELESLAEDWLEAELKRENDSFDSAS